MKIQQTENTIHIHLRAVDARQLDTQSLKSCTWLLSEITHAMQQHGADTAELYAPRQDVSFATVKAA